MLKHIIKKISSKVANLHKNHVNDIYIYRNNCLKILKAIPKESIDLIVTDPPYKLISYGSTGLGGIFKKAQSDNLQGKLFKHNDIDAYEYASLFYKILKDKTACYVMTNDSNLKDMLIAFEKAGFNFLKLICWDKKNKIVTRYYMNQCEYILLFRKGSYKRVNNCSMSNLISISNLANKKNGHPTEKPVDLMKIFIEQSSKEGDIILDPFVGVGATAIACKQTGRKFIGCEIDKKYFKTTIKRLKEKQIKSIFK